MASGQILERLIFR